MSGLVHIAPSVKYVLNKNLLSGKHSVVYTKFP